MTEEWRPVLGWEGLYEVSDQGRVRSVDRIVRNRPGVTLTIYGSRERPAENAAGLYEALRFFDDHPVDVIFAEGVREEGIGRALMNRLYKAASSVGEGI